METRHSKKEKKYPRKKNIFRPALRFRKTGKNLILQKEAWIFISGLLIALFIITIIFLVLWGKFTIMFYWVIGLLAIFFTRKTNAWKMGMEIHFPLMFYTTYAFGPLFAFSMFLIPYAGVWKARPDEGTGVMIQATSLSIMIGITLIFKYIYGALISSSQFLLAFIIAIVLVQVIDGILSKMFSPSAPMKIIIVHSLDILINIYIAKLVGYQIIKYFLALA